MPSVPPSSQPTITTATSIAVPPAAPTGRCDARARSSGRPAARARGPRRCRPPWRARRVATPSSIRPTRGAGASMSGSTRSAASTASPMTTTLLTVPRPGRSRSGIQLSSTSSPTAMVTVPRLHPSCRASPCRADVPGHRAELRAHQQGHRYPVEREAKVELDQPASAVRGREQSARGSIEGGDPAQRHALHPASRPARSSRANPEELA